MKEEKVEKIEKMQSLIIQELKDKKPEKKKESSFLEKDYIEWEMKTLTNNNRVRWIYLFFYSIKFWLSSHDRITIVWIQTNISN